MGTRLEAIRKKSLEHCIPLNVTFEITLRCNLRCVHCYNFDRDLRYPPSRDADEELTDAEIHRVLDEVHGEGCLFLAFTGGEALAHPRLSEFVRHAAGCGMAVTLKSNGVLLSADRVEALAAAGATAVDVSLYGAEAPTHDAFVRSPGAFDKTIAGARAAREAGFLVKLSLVAVQSNAAEIGRMMDLAQSIGAGYTVSPQIMARHDGSRSSLDVRMDRETVDRLYRGPVRHLLEAGDTGRTSVQCGCARSVCGISAFGEVYPCIGAPLPSGNLRERSFHEIWTTSPTLRWIRGLTLDDFPACRGCAHMEHCRRSSGTLYSTTGLYTGPARFGDDWTCMEAEVIHRIHDEN